MSITGVGQPCPTCGRPIEAVGVEHCPSCAAAKCDLGERRKRRRWKRKRPEGVGIPGEGWHSARAVERAARELAERDEERVEE
ncbi:MAG: hypothetical protein RJA59_2300 [Pseudomonadota bacterium]